jgi:predicted transcriptional regulator
MNVLLSIKPRYVEAILKGDKRYEFRKNIFRNKDVENLGIIKEVLPLRSKV